MNGKELISLEASVAEALVKASEDFPELFEEQRRVYGKMCMGKLRLVNRASHRVFRYLGKGNLVEAQVVYMECKDHYAELLESLETLPNLIAAEVRNNAGQELTEAAMGIAFYQILVGEKETNELKLPTCDELDVTPQAWLAGVADFASEVSKLAECVRGRLVRTGKLAISENELCERLLSITDGIQKYFDRYDESYPRILDASNRRFAGFHSKERMVGNASLWAVKLLNAVELSPEPEED
jgi:predicted translin family RNA/ssDNA-binding protein